MNNELPFDEWLIRALKSPKIQQALGNGWPITTVRPDPDLLGATTGQAHLLIQGIPSWSPQLTDEFSIRTNSVALKLTALRYHLRRYREIQVLRHKQILSNELVLESIKKGLRFCEMEMLHEVEALFFQYKSALDMLVKILCPITKKTAGTFSTYSKSGSKLVPILNKLKEDGNLELTPGRIDWLIETIEKAKSPWLESVIRIRDTFSHYRPEINFGFQWNSELEEIIVPQFETDNGYRPFDVVMGDLIESLIRYCTEFIAIAVSCAIPLEQGIQVLSDNEKEFISARWNMNLSRAQWKLASNMIVHYTETDIENARKLAEAENL